ncbi:hypothetical protein QA641_04670 [Bradyrhizobium sp. CB1650]|uniref:hypothetical protein n=1 Tax=Bradyrhizobium sp. CB1650 TaxID=3039153 RepID=UPI0024352E3D|nr:hypothetical protein [Bradyrhizobium sp. CB1650]WGD53224.1 hypothetical protein QA641_04670 [Bradyrhizobium sp. CB1650]
MLVVTVELWPGGSAWMRGCIASMRIENISNLAPVSDYLVEAVEEFNPLTEHPRRTTECLAAVTDGTDVDIVEKLDRACRRSGYRPFAQTAHMRSQCEELKKRWT